MSMDNALAAGQGGTEANPAPQSRIPAQETPTHTPEDDEPPDDDTQRRRVADRLSVQLDLGVDLASVCELLAGPANKKGRIEAVYAAARLAQANAQLGRSIAHLLQVERRQKTIVERIQQPTPFFGHSNFSEQDALIDAMNTKILRYLKVMADETLDPALEEAEDDAAAQANPAPAATPSA